MEMPTAGELMSPSAKPSLKNAVDMRRGVMLVGSFGRVVCYLGIRWWGCACCCVRWLSWDVSMNGNLTA